MTLGVPRRRWKDKPNRRSGRCLPLSALLDAYAVPWLLRNVEVLFDMAENTRPLTPIRIGQLW
jgi:hypothetical protein